MIQSTRFSSFQVPRQNGLPGCAVIPVNSVSSKPSTAKVRVILCHLYADTI